MKILIVSSFFPYPPYSGGQVRLFNLLRQLSKRHQITLICPIREEKERRYLPEIKKFCERVILTYRGPQWSLRNITHSVFSLSSFLFVGHRSEEMRRRIKEELAQGDYDLLQLETSYVMPNLPKIKLPVILSEYNLEYLVYQRYVANFKFFPLKPLLYFDVWKMRREEKKIWQRADLIISVSGQEKEKMIEEGIKEEKIFVVPNGVDIRNFKVQSSKFKIKEAKTLLFVGDFRWFPNREAVEWLIEKIWPKIEFKVQSSKLKVSLIIAGRESEYLKDKLKYRGIRVIGEIRDIKEVYKKASILLAPMKIGGGTKFKILEAMAAGVAVVTTPIGIEGIEAENEKELLIAKTGEELAEAVLKLLKNQNLRENLIRNARRLVKQEYDWEKIAEKLEEVYRRI